MNTDIPKDQGITSFYSFNFIDLLYTQCSTCVYVCMSEEGTIMDDCELPRCCWELNSGPQQPVLLSSEPSLQLQDFIFYNATLFL